MKCIPIRDLKDTAAVAAMCQESPNPIYVTKNGYNTMVIMSTEVYERIRPYTIYERLMQSEEAAKEGKLLTPAESTQVLRDKYGL